MNSDTSQALALGDSIPGLAIVRGADGKVAAMPDAVLVRQDDREEPLALPPIRELFRGTRKPGDLSREPTKELEPFFMFLEYTLVRFCAADGRDETDQEMERIYAALKKRPDGAGGRLQSYIRAAARLYMSAREVSAAEYDAVMGRLARSARTFSVQPISRNYLATLHATFRV